MTDILHRVKINGTAKKVYESLTTADGLSNWWTKATTNTAIGGSAQFFFGADQSHIITMEIIELIEDQKVVWKCIEGPWVDTGLFTFSIRTDDDASITLLFSHQGWPEPSEFYMHCNGKWGFFLIVSLKTYIETGKGLPHPHDPDM